MLVSTDNNATSPRLVTTVGPTAGNSDPASNIPIVSLVYTSNDVVNLPLKKLASKPKLLDTTFSHVKLGLTSAGNPIVT